MYEKKTISKLELVFIIVTVLIFALVCLRNWSFFYIPNIDIYQYICDARAYYNGQFPPYVQPQPLYSLLIYPVSLLFYSHNYPEIKTGIAISLLSSILGLFFTYLLSRRYLSLIWRMVLMTLLFCHPLFFYGAVNTTPDALLFFCVILSIYSYTWNRSLGYFFAIMASLVKFEGYVVLGMMIVTELITYYQQHKTLKIDLEKVRSGFRLKTHLLPVVAFLVLIIWQVITISYNFKQIGFSNFFIKEVAQANQPLPDLRKTARFFDLIQADVAIFNTNFSNNDMFEVVFVVTLFGTLAVVSYQKKLWPLFISVGFCAGYLLIHSFFPAYNPRYFLPILALLFLYICIILQSVVKSSKKSAWLVILIGTLLISSWAFDLYRYKYERFMMQDKYNQAEERLVGEWLNEYQKEQGGQYNIIGPVERIHGYLDGSDIKNPFSKGILDRPLCEGTPLTVESQHASVTIFNSTFPEFAHCKDSLCLVEALPESSNTVLIVDSSDSTFTISPEVCFKKLQELEIAGRFATIYEFEKSLCSLQLQ